MSLESVFSFLMLFMQMLNISNLIPSGLFKPLKDLFFFFQPEKKAQKQTRKPNEKRKHIFFKEI